MKEMELFVDLLDEQEANKILTYFQETPTGTRKNTATLEQKKIHLKKVFKCITPNMIRKRKKGAPDPFYTYINNYKFPKVQINNFTEYINFLNEDDDTIVPSYIGFADLLLKFPEEMRNKLDQIEKNINNGNKPLDIGESFETIENLKEFLRKSRDYIGEKASINIFNNLKKFQKENIDDNLEKCKERVKDLDLLQFYSSRNKLKQEFGIEISNAAYILTHPDEESDIALLLAIESLFFSLEQQRVDAINDLDEKLNAAISNTKAEEEAVKRVIIEKNKEISNLKAELKQKNKILKLLEISIENKDAKIKNIEHMHLEEVQRLSNIFSDQEKRIIQKQKDYEKKLYKITH